MPEFTLNRNHRLISLTGHTIQFVKGEPVAVPAVLKGEVIAIGAQPVDGNTDVLDEEKEIVELIAKYPDRGEMMLDFLMVAKYFERIGDHATNVAEWVEFSITGERPVMTKYTFDQKTMEEKKLARDERVFKRFQ